MNLEKLSAYIRPRSAWEAVDLGTAMVRRDFLSLVLHWCCTVLPLQILIFALLYQYSMWAFMLVWWLKPLYDRVPLFFLSRRLFGDKPGLREVLKNLKGLWTRRFLWTLTLGRLSPSRSFTMPVYELEGLRGQAYNKRVRLLARYGDGVSSQIILACVNLELLISVSMMYFFQGMIPEHARGEVLNELERLFLYGGEDLFDLQSYILSATFYVLAMMFMELFYVGAGFGLYVNSRTITEGWDIELSFRKLKERITEGSRKFIALLIAAFTLGMSVSAEAYLEDPSGTMEGILQSEDFEVHSKIIKVPVQEENSSSGGDEGWWSSFWRWVFGDGSGSSSSSDWTWGGQFWEALGTLLFWGLIFAVLGWLGWLLYKNWNGLAIRFGREKASAEVERTKVVAGLEVSPESLPGDIRSAARAALAQGNVHLALSLLYRGALSEIISRSEVAIQESDTEYDCVKKVNAAIGGEISNDFAELTGAWVNLAYGKQEPSESRMETVILAWQYDQLSLRKEGAA